MHSAIEILEDAREKRLAFNAIIRQIEEARSKAEGTMAVDIAGRAAGDGRGGTTDTRYTNLIELQEQAENYLGEYLQSWYKGFEVVKQLEAVEGVCRYSFILQSRYLYANDWSYIAERLKITLQHCHKEKKIALQKLEALELFYVR